MSASKTILNLLRLIAAAVVGYGIAYMWMSIRAEEDIMLLAGIGMVSGVLTYALLYMFGKGGGSG